MEVRQGKTWRNSCNGNVVFDDIICHTMQVDCDFFSVHDGGHLRELWDARGLPWRLLAA